MPFDLQVFNKQTYAAMTEVVDQQVQLFNAASGGTLVLASGQNQGDFSMEASFKQIAGLVRRRNAYGTGTVAAKRLEHLLNVSVKVAAGTPPVEFEKQQYTWILQNPELAAIKIGEQLAIAQVQDQLNAGIRALVAATSGNAAVIHDGSAAAPTFRVLNKGSAKFGDRAGSLRAWVLHSTVLHSLYDNALTNAEQLFSYGTVNVMRDAFGRLFVVTDSDALVNAGETPTYNTLGLVEGAGIVQPNGDFHAVLQDAVGSENIKTTYQAEWTYNVGLKGYAWDTAAGGKSPTDVALGTATNWDKVATSNKDTAGVLIKTL
ncbi:major capsid protein [Pseudomonas chlororaphis subsp. piscium]